MSSVTTEDQLLTVIQSLKNTIARYEAMIQNQNDWIEEQRYTNCGGVMVSRETMDALHVLYPGGLLTTPDEAMESVLDHCLGTFMRQAALRAEFSLTGAMRWPWSQEAPIRIKLDRMIRAG